MTLTECVQKLVSLRELFVNVLRGLGLSVGNKLGLSEIHSCLDELETDRLNKQDVVMEIYENGNLYSCLASLDNDLLYRGLNYILKDEKRKFDVSIAGLLNIINTFESCVSLRSFTYVSGCLTSDDCSYMFSDCSNLESFTMSRQCGTKIRTADHMFSQCENLKTVILGEGFGSELQSAYGMFYGCSCLQTLELPEGFGKKLGTAGPKDDDYAIEGMFIECSSLERLSIPEGFGIAATAADLMFDECVSLKELCFPEGFGLKFNSCRYMFDECISLEKIELPNGFGKGCHDCEGMFQGCSSLTTIKCNDANVESPKILAVNDSLDLSPTDLDRESLILIMDSLPQLDGRLDLVLGVKLISKLNKDKIGMAKIKSCIYKGWNIR